MTFNWIELLYNIFYDFVSLGMDLRQKIWLINDYPLWPGPFFGSKPHTLKCVLLKFKGYHHQFHVDSNGTSSVNDAEKRTAQDIINWWKKTNILLKSENGLIDMILKLESDWKVMFYQRKKDTLQQSTKRSEFLESMEKTFWAVCPDYEKILENSKDPRKVQDFKFLQKMKSDREGGII